MAEAATMPAGRGLVSTEGGCPLVLRESQASAEGGPIGLRESQVCAEGGLYNRGAYGIALASAAPSVFRTHA